MDDREEIENSVECSERNWKRVIDAATKSGYREGIEEGKQSVFQQGFDLGYEDSFRTAFILGKYKGLATSLANDGHSSSPVDDILEKTRRGGCCICAKESNGSTTTIVGDDFTEQPIEEVRNEQKKHSERTLETLHKHFKNLLKDKGLSIEDFAL